MARKMARDDGPTRHPPPESVDGPTGDDEGQSIGIPISGTYSTDFNAAHNDDHHVDVDHHDPYPYPPWFYRRGAKRSDGDDHTHWPEDHVVGADNDGLSSVPVRPAWEKEDDHADFPFKKRAAQPGDAPDSVDGPTGDDEGQEANIPISSTWSTEAHWWHNDDHSVDVHDHPYYPYVKRTDGHDGPDAVAVSGVSSENENNYNNDDHSVDVHDHPYYPYARRAAQPHDGPDSVDGPTGDDEGQEASIPISGTWSNEANWWHNDDHSVDVHDHPYYPYVKRTDGHDGPDAVAVGGVSSENENNYNNDDHSVDVHDHPYYPYVKRTDGHDGPDAVAVSGVSSKDENNYNHDDHSVDVDKHDSPYDFGTEHGPQAVKTMHMVHTVTHTEYRESHGTAQCQQPAAPVTVHVPMACGSSMATPSSPALFHAPSSSMAPVSSMAPLQSSTSVVKMYAPASSSAFVTPSSAVAPKLFAPSSSMATPSSSASVSPSASSSFVPFTGGASHVSSAASVAAVVGGLSALLALVL
ncbi:GPI anchored protein [Aspergillus sclerotialis]|uniref:GPI anchored protein n=1 Tax=Aspergillus sclerotialis TaxID=2070753 RepID=A0A3A2Z814_9EURO|nr:GPI anchored protein [Aspergillus sclerotialis]